MSTPILPPLRAAYDALADGSQTLPGFEMVAFEQGCCSALQGSTMNAYSVWVMEYAHVPNYPVSGLIYGAHNQGHRRLPYCYVVIKGQGHIAMVDIGYNHKAYGETLANLYGVRDWHSPRAVLAEMGITPADISTIFITHAHFDHMGNIEDFPNAKFYLQEREL